MPRCAKAAHWRPPYEHSHAPSRKRELSWYCGGGPLRPHCDAASFLSSRFGHLFADGRPLGELRHVPAAALVVAAALALSTSELALAVVAARRRRRQRARRATLADSDAPRRASIAAAAGESAAARVRRYWQLLEREVLRGARRPPSSPTDLSSLLAAPADAAAHVAGNAGGSGSSSVAALDEAEHLGLPSVASFVSQGLHEGGGSPTTSTAAGTGAGELTRVLVPPLEGCFSRDGARGPWGALRRLWTDAVRYKADDYHVGKLLGALDAAAVARALSQKDAAAADAFAVSAVNLALVWQLCVLRRAFHALVVFSDTQKCKDEMAELRQRREAVLRAVLLPATVYLLRRQATPTGAGGGSAGGSDGDDSDCDAPADLCVARDASDDAEGRGGDGVRVRCAPLRCWAALGRCLAALEGRERALNRMYMRSLFRYFYSFQLRADGDDGVAHNRYVSSALLAAMTAATSKVVACGAQARQRIAELLPAVFTCAAGDGAAAALAGRLLLLCGVEVCRHAVHAFLQACVHELIQLAAQRRRDRNKALIYGALARLPLSFYDFHDHEEVEQIVYYINDLEGVDVHVHQYVFGLLSAAFTAREALAALGTTGGGGGLQLALRQQWIAAAVAGLSVAVSYALQAASAAVAREYQSRRRAGTLPLLLGGGERGRGDDDEDGDLQTRENISSRVSRDGAMLRGLEIVSAVPALRCYGADVRLMDEWNGHLYGGGGGGARGGATGAAGGSDGAGSFCRAPVRWAVRPPALLLAGLRGAAAARAQQFGALLPDLARGLAALLAWVAPLAFAAGGAHALVHGTACDATAERRRRVAAALAEAAESVRQVVEALLDGHRVAELVLLNAYKARVIERLLSPRQWEYSAGGGGDDAAGAPPLTAADREERAFSERELLGGGGAAWQLESVRLDGLAFRYPSAPTVDVFGRGGGGQLSGELRLRAPGGGEGRLLALVGPSGCGKSTLLSLLLGLYSPTAGSATLVFADESTGGGDGGRRRHTVGVGNVPTEALRGRVFGCVPQTATVFSGATIAQNVSLRNAASLEDEAAAARVRACCVAAHCWDFIERLPQQLFTAIGAPNDYAVGGGLEGLVRLSGGQAQRLMIARALYQRPAGGGGCGGGGALRPVLLMDEPTASLDRESRAEVIATLRDLLARGEVGAVLCSTHDDTLIAAADEVLTLQADGTISAAPPTAAD